MRAAARSALLAAWALALGCAGSPPPADTFYRLAVAAPAPRAVPLLPGTVEVDRPQASDALRGRALAVVHADRPGVLRHANYDYWVDAPPTLLQEALIERLRAGAVADRVSAPGRQDDAAWIVSGRIDRFERIVGGGDGAAVAVELSLLHRADRRVVVSERYEATRGAHDGSVESAVEALGVAVAEVVDAFLADVEAALAARD